MSTTVTISNAPALAARTDETVIKKWELGVSCILHLWDVLATAVTNQWSGPSSSDKRDWLCGEIADMYTNAKVDGNGKEEVDEYDIEEVLSQVMEDEFMVVVDDGSEVVIASEIQKLRIQVLCYDFSGVEEVYLKWNSRTRGSSGSGAGGTIVAVQSNSDEEDEDNSDEEDDVEMADIEGDDYDGSRRPEPVIDEEGFELVQNRGERGKWNRRK